MNQYPDVIHPQDGKSRLGGHSFSYFNFCETAYSKYLEKRGNTPYITDEMEKCDLESEAFEHGVRTIIFAALCAEAAINDYGSWQLGDTYFNAHLNSMDVASKWVVVPRLVCGKELDKSGPGYSHLVSLVRSRNEWVHNHSMDYKPNDPASTQLLDKRSRNFEIQVDTAYRALLLLSLEFDYLIGPRFNPLPTLDKDISPAQQAPDNLIGVRAECKGVAARNRGR